MSPSNEASSQAAAHLPRPKTWLNMARPSHDLLLAFCNCKIACLIQLA